MLMYLSMIETPDDKVKFERIYNRYRNLMYHVAYKVLSNHYDAEDAVHQAFVAIIRHLEKISDIDCPQTRSYIVLITERKAIDLIRTRHSEKVIPLNEDLIGIEIPAPGDHGLADALAKLPAHYREVLLLRFDNGYSAKELAQMLGMTESGVRKLIGRAKNALGRILEEESYAKH
jgi:RNA polymerase sigma-70 factor (ECF subfamily)